jgi:hypothetical protein
MLYQVGFEVFVASMMMAVFWVLSRCSLVVYQRFRGTFCLHHQGDELMEAARTSETLVNFYQTARRYNPEEAIFLYQVGRQSFVSENLSCSRSRQWDVLHPLQCVYVLVGMEWWT